MNSFVERRQPVCPGAERTNNIRLLFQLLQAVTRHQAMAKLLAVRPLFVGEFNETPMIIWKRPRTQESCPIESLEGAKAVSDRVEYEPDGLDLILSRQHSHNGCLPA